MAGLQLYVRTGLSSELCAVEVDSDATLGDLRSAIAKLCGVEAPTIQYQGVTLSVDSTLLADTGLSQEATVDVLSRLAWSPDETDLLQVKLVEYNVIKGIRKSGNGRWVRSSLLEKGVPRSWIISAPRRYNIDMLPGAKGGTLHFYFGVVTEEQPRDLVGSPADDTKYAFAMHSGGGTYCGNKSQQTSSGKHEVTQDSTHRFQYDGDDCLHVTAIEDEQVRGTCTMSGLSQVSCPMYIGVGTRNTEVGVMLSPA
eukprot:TRINITY_DN9078_c0_g2_i1.p1 TRINITY_DN9078_c0_g2~~TRINITY_DN9078_c0_g2_i1.p1  ORF type:complete len:254 (+),score=25.48 TRINITY_DN9078_c0_g2_i1:95-856(+)